MQDRFNLEPGTRVLHIAPEDGIERRLKGIGLEYITGDAAPGAMLQLDVAALPFADERFDLAIRELRRVLASRGRLLTQNPIHYGAEIAYGGPDAVESARSTRLPRRYHRDLGKKFERAGFDVETFSLKELADKPSIEHYGLTEYTPKEKRGREATMLIQADEPIPDAVLEQVQAFEWVRSARRLQKVTD